MNNIDNIIKNMNQQQDYEFQYDDTDEHLSSDWSLQLDSMKLESLVIGDQRASYDRICRYAKYSEMSCDPILVGAIDGLVERIYFDFFFDSECNEVINELTNLWSERIKYKEFIRMWIRSLLVYGDLFLLNNISPKKGVMTLNQINASEIAREEGFDPNNPFAVRFRWVTEGNQILENWQVYHFRLLTNGCYMPYGISRLDTICEAWRRMKVAEEQKDWRAVRHYERKCMRGIRDNKNHIVVNSFINYVKGIIKHEIRKISNIHLELIGLSERRFLIHEVR